MSGFSLALEFDRPDHEFAMGVEIGRLWELAKGDDELRETIHAENAEMVVRIAEATGREFSAEIVDEWAEVWLGPNERAAAPSLHRGC